MDVFDLQEAEPFAAQTHLKDGGEKGADAQTFEALVDGRVGPVSTRVYPKNQNLRSVRGP